MKSVAGGRTACIDLPAFFLQLVLRRRPHWRNGPVAVVSKETPQGKILLASGKARGKGIVAGLSYAAALGLLPELRAAAVSPADIADGKAVVMKQLQDFSPKVQADSGDSATFWLDASGLNHLYPSLHTWGDRIRMALRQLGFKAVVVIGFSRFGTFALARSKSRKTMVLHSHEEEMALARRVLLTHLGLPLWITRELSGLGKNTIGDLISFPATDILDRYGSRIYRLWSLASGNLREPLAAEKVENPPAVSLILDDPESHVLRLTFLIKRLLRELLSKIAARGHALAELQISLRLDANSYVVEQLCPARHTLNEIQLTDLVRLRLEHTPLKAGVIEIRLDAKTVPATTRQLQLFVERPRRDPEAAGKAFDRLRAQFGPDTVVQIKLHPAHLPEARFSFEPAGHATRPKAIAQSRPTLVRRIFTRPRPLKGCPLPQQGRNLKTKGANLSSHVNGPYILSGGWWNRTLHREYYFVQTKTGDVLWVYFDGKRGRWFLHGTVE